MRNSQFGKPHDWFDEEKGRGIAALSFWVYQANDLLPSGAFPTYDIQIFYPANKMESALAELFAAALN